MIQPLTIQLDGVAFCEGGVEQVLDSGNVIVVTPMAKAQPGTLKNGKQRFSLTRKMLAEMVGNYAEWRTAGGAPLPGYFGHARTAEEIQKRASGDVEPALFILDAWADGDTLWGRVEFTAAAWNKADRGGQRPFRGLSIVFSEAGVDLNGKSVGAVLFGVDVTPTPFLPGVEIPEAASKRLDTYSFSASTYATLSSEWSADAEDGTNMDEVTKTLIADKDRQIKRLEDECKTLRDAETAGVQAATDAKAAAETAQAAASESADEIKKLKAELSTAATAALAKEAKQAIELALNIKLIDVAQVEGYHESDAKALAAFENLDWFRNPAGLVAMCEREVESGNRVTMGKQVTAGTPGKTKTAETAEANALRIKLAKDNPNATTEQLDEIAAQGPYLARVEEIREAAVKADQGLTYSDALQLARDKHPEDYRAYLAATGRDD